MPKSKNNILFVDEEKKQIEAFKKMLMPMSGQWELHFANSAKEALELIEIQPFDIVVTDFHTTGLPDGELISEVRKQQPGAIRFILSKDQNTNKSMHSAMYAHQFISKPCSAKELIETIERCLRLKNIFLNERVSKAIASIDELPVMPSLYIKLEKELRKEDVSIKNIGLLISEDLAITSGILKLVNSSFFGLYSKITTPEKAATMLGISTIKGLVLGMHIFNSSKTEYLDFSIENLGEHCLYTALLARAVIQAEGADTDTAEKTFLAGFLHDIGKLILCVSYQPEYSEILKIVQNENIPMSVAEKEIFGFTHAEVGAYLLALWGFDETVVEAVYSHHNLTEPDSDMLSPAAAVHIADTFEHELRLRHQENAPHILNAEWLEKNGFSSKLVGWLEVCAQQLDKDLTNINP
ncbi:response regulator [Maridesulfovibrio ferrireducens]|uniref:response regulator n=1 Tax=Maridesulfovibrio ferrireducens TaxID=246191 RepID=UPI001A2DDA37|nr:response regulator [Maridesulfovibrio ferrireducens]MBI9112490.1 HDOD domain-containing protein [Maridesulfovibrio ferrireducens]